ncbi:ribosomal protein S18-alanine N-acetyltransferase [Zhihengliuella flava]|uniref:Ribosomal-protein-alanine N-acetyltransferase n=1 Tax=Zhihengliuella flava TaxID=1285193 RepID=A0A931DES1_9MICC|nr:ribosomal protein S18-alanine N-acetyltransferase [Zhihengliuella flava]MBG6085448.1 ribosomal-protein-alanine N-acetyltransferase [Zhihengliuella flava]
MSQRAASGQPGGGWALRDMVAADIPEVYALELWLFPEDAWPRDMFDAELAQAGRGDDVRPAGPGKPAPQPPTRRYWVAEVEGQIVGYAGMMCVLPIADVQTIAVDSQFEGRGLGTAFLQAIIDESRTRGAENVMLEVREDNQRAQQLYERHGFRQIHVRPNYYPGSVAAHIMQLPLS